MSWAGDENGHPHDPGIVNTREQIRPNDSRCFSRGRKKTVLLFVAHTRNGRVSEPTAAGTQLSFRARPAKTCASKRTSDRRLNGRPRRRTRRRDGRERTDAVARRRHSIFFGPVPFERATIADDRVAPPSMYRRRRQRWRCIDTPAAICRRYTSARTPANTGPGIKFKEILGQRCPT